MKWLAAHQFHLTQGEDVMAILVGKDTKLIVQGMTGRSGTFYSDLALNYPILFNGFFVTN